MRQGGDLVVMGSPGSGKGTQARLLEADGFVQLATGDLFREHMRMGTSLGRIAEQHMSRGAYVPDHVTVGMVRQRLAGIPASTRIVFDGFPRTVAQAEALDGLLREHGRKVSRVVLFEVRSDEVARRLSGRVPEGRADDSPEVVRQRLEVYDQETRPVVERYERAGLLCRIDGGGSVEAVRARLLEAIV